MTGRRREYGDRVFLVITPALGLVELGAGAVNLYLGNWVVGAAALVFGLLFLGWRRMRTAWIRIGYLRGRIAFMDSLLEAVHRGMTPQEFLQTEIERTTGVTIIDTPREEPDG